MQQPDVPVRSGWTSHEYQCACGHRFPLQLGAYGCPNCCCCDQGPARIVEKQEKQS